MLRSICESLGISNDHIVILENIDSNLQYIADLVMSDVFIDCFQMNSEKAIVVGQARPSNGFSLYDRIIVGEEVLPEKEPAVFAAKKSGMAFRDIRATTQEDKIVKQNIVPVKDSGDHVIAVLICEYDVSGDVIRDKKYQYLARTVENMFPGNVPSVRKNIQEKEIHHRVKNNLQTVASILNIQARNVESEELRIALKENVNRIMSIASIHDLMTNQGKENYLAIREILEKVVQNILAYSDDTEKKIEVCVLGDDVMVDADKAVTIASITNELVTNAMKHAFMNHNDGRIEIYVGKGNSRVFITVKDNGDGFKEPILEEGHFGLGIVKAMVKDKLQGNLQMNSSVLGTKITFDFKCCM